MAKIIRRVWSSRPARRTREALVWLGTARGLPMADVARALNVSPQRAQLLARARTALEPIAASRTAEASPWSPSRARSA